jgi:hypothetical protein
MAYEQIVCHTVWRVTVEQLDISARNVISCAVLGDFETNQDAETILADEGFIRATSPCGWERNWTYQHAKISKVLVEQKVICNE